MRQLSSVKITPADVRSDYFTFTSKSQSGRFSVSSGAVDRLATQGPVSVSTDLWYLQVKQVPNLRLPFRHRTLRR